MFVRITYNINLSRRDRLVCDAPKSCHRLQTSDRPRDRLVCENVIFKVRK